MREHNVDIIWFIEHESRELNVACAIQDIIYKRYGNFMEILPYYSENPDEIICRYYPKVVAVPFCYYIHDSKLHEYIPYWQNSTYFNLAWEELFYNAILDFKRPRDTFAKRYIIHHAWGEFYKNYLIKQGVPEDHIFVNGHPAYKLYDEPYCSNCVTRADLAGQFGLNVGYKWIFFPENYGWAFYPEDRINHMIEKGLDPKSTSLMHDFCYASLEIVLGWLEKVVANGSVEVILRPRPATRITDFEQVVDKIIPQLPERIHIIKEWSVREWIMASDIIISSYSTTLIEGAIAGRPTYMVEPIPTPYPLRADWHVYVTRLENYDEFASICLGELALHDNNTLQNWARKELMGVDDPISNLADFLHHLCQPNTPVIRIPAEEVNKALVFKRLDEDTKKIRRLFLEGRLDEAIEECERCLNVSKSIILIYILGSCFKRRGDCEKAIEKFKEVLSLETENEKVYHAGAHFHLGEIYQAQGDLDKARAEFRECLRLNPAHRKARESLDTIGHRIKEVE
jgi:tetratricopeptide (TPR) repeat protein